MMREVAKQVSVERREGERADEWLPDNHLRFRGRPDNQSSFSVSDGSNSAAGSINQPRGASGMVSASYLMSHLTETHSGELWEGPEFFNHGKDERGPLSRRTCSSAKQKEA